MTEWHPTLGGEHWFHNSKKHWWRLSWSANTVSCLSYARGYCCTVEPHCELNAYKTHLGIRAFRHLMGQADVRSGRHVYFPLSWLCCHCFAVDVRSFITPYGSLSTKWFEISLLRWHGRRHATRMFHAVTQHTAAFWAYMQGKRKRSSCMQKEVNDGGSLPSLFLALRGWSCVRNCRSDRGLILRDLFCNVVYFGKIF